MIKFEEGEQIVKVIRRHWFVMLPVVLGFLLVSILPVFVYKVLFSGLIPLGEVGTTLVKSFVSEWSVFAYSIWLLILWVMFFVEWTDYYLDLWVVTDRRIVDIEQKGFFNREVTSFGFRQIQDITVETKGVLETFFKFGTLHIQTAGHDRPILIKDADHPEEARTLILGLQEKLIAR